MTWLSVEFASSSISFILRRVNSQPRQWHGYTMDGTYDASADCEETTGSQVLVLRSKLNGCLSSVFFVAAKSLVGPRYNSEIDPTARKFLKENMPKPEV